MTRGKRSDILDLERELSEKVSGPRNNEDWAGSKKGQQLSPEAEEMNNKMKRYRNSH